MIVEYLVRADMITEQLLDYLSVVADGQSIRAIGTERCSNMAVGKNGSQRRDVS